MKSRIITLLSILILVSDCSNAPKKNNDLKEMNLFGKVKSIREISYEAIVEASKIKKGKRLSFLNHDKFILFNKSGNKIQQIDYYLDLNFSEKRIHKYDKKGNISEIIEHNTDGSIAYRKFFKYIINENVIIRKEYINKNLENWFLNEYNDQGNRIMEIWYDADSTLVLKETYKYDNRGFEIQRSVSNSIDSLQEIKKFNYNQKENKIEEKHFNLSYFKSRNKTHVKNDTSIPITQIKPRWSGKDKYLFSKSTFIYDDNGNEIAKTYLGQFDDLDYTNKKTYVYDNKKNWKEMIFIENGIPKSVVERKIEYYK